LYHFRNRQEASHDGNDTKKNARRGDMVHVALQWCCPILDWSYLRRRPEQFSAKAIANLRQQQELTSSSTATHKQVDWEVAATAIADVEYAMDNMTTFASAAITAENEIVENDTDWMVVAPTEQDLDELKECILSYDGTGNDDDDDVEERFPVEEIVHVLCDRWRFSNWRELANTAMGATEMYQQLMELLPKHETHPQHNENTPVVPVSTQAIEMWIEFAQLQSMEEIMVEICDGNVAGVEVLRDAMRSGTPNDLATWGSIVRTLQDQLMIAAADDDANME
jgi:hypothetical protein